MKRILTSLVAGSLILSSAAAMAGENPDCKLDAADASIQATIDAIKSSPAYGHAGGHYGKAEKDLGAVKKQLHAGCAAWNKDQAKKAGAPSK